MKGGQRRPGRPAGPDAGRAGDVRADQAPGAARRARRRSFAADVRLALLPPGDPTPSARSARRSTAAATRRRRRGRDDRVSARLLIAVADDETARRAAAQAREAELEVVDIVDRPRGAAPRAAPAGRRRRAAARRARRHAGARPRARARRRVPRGRADPARRRGLARAAARGDAGRPARRRRAARSRSSPSRPACAPPSQWSRTMRDRVTGEESASGALGGQLIAVAGAKGGVGTTTRRAAPRPRGGADGARPARSASSTSTSRRATSARCWTRRTGAASSTSSTSRNEISVRHLQETLYTHKDGFRLLLAPEEGERGRGRRLRRRPQRAQRRQGAPRADRRRHRRRRHRGDRDRRRDGRPRCSSSPRRTCSRCAACGACASCGSGSACARTRTSRSCSTGPRAGARSSPTWRARSSATRWPRRTIPADFNAFEAAVNTGSPSRMEDGKLRAAFEALAIELDIVPQAEEVAPPRRRAARAAGPPRRRARPVHAPSSWACCRSCSWSSSRSGRSR